MCVVILALIFSCLFYYVPFLQHISSGLVISICAITAALLGAVLFPVKEENES